MRFCSDSQRRAVFANMGKFARKPSEKMIREIVESAEEPITDFRQMVPAPGAKIRRTIDEREVGLKRRMDIPRVVEETTPTFPEHGYKFFTPESSGSIEEAKEDASIVAETITGGNAVGWVQPIWMGGELKGYTVRLRNIDTGEDLLDTDTSVYENELY